MKLQANYHTHTALCGHAAGMSGDYIREAIANGLKEIGFSDHGPIPRAFMTPREYADNWLERQMDERIFESVYLPDLAESIRKYGSKISIRTGLEIEYLPGHDDYYRWLLTKVEYLVLGIHYFPSEGGLYNAYDRMDAPRIAEYAALAEQALSTGFFTILAHPDLFLMTYRDEQGVLLFDEAAAAATRRIIEASVKYGVILEVNGGGPRRGRYVSQDGMDWLYPRTAFWRVVASYPVARAVIGCDTHNPPNLCDAVIDATIAFAERFKLNLLPRIDLESERKRQR
ncbi:MAG: PHP domain-containing protein [Bacillota bacterium]|nr:PHP domain-containing protein [Bacillota bacterium]